MGHHVRAVGLHRGLTRSVARDWTRAVRCCLAVIACLAQLMVAAQHHPHAPGFAAHAMVHEAASSSSGVTAASFHAEQSGVPCAFHGTRANDGNGSGGAPCPCCPHGDCPFCPCPCCSRTSMPRSAFCRRKRRGQPMRLRFPRLSRRPRVSAQPRVLRFSPGNPARLPSRSD